MTCVTEITVQDQVEHALEAVVSHYGAIPDVLVNNAGGLFDIGPLIDVNISDFCKASKLNVKGPVIMTQAYLRANRKHSPEAARTVINIASGAAHVP